MGKYTYQYKGFRKNRLCLATSSKTSRMHLTKLALYNEIPAKAFSTLKTRTNYAVRSRIFKRGKELHFIFWLQRG